MLFCMNTTYPSDLTDAEWECLQPYLLQSRSNCRTRRHSLRTILNAIFYVLPTGCPWVSGRYLPSRFPPWQTVFYHFRRFRLRQPPARSCYHLLRIPPVPPSPPCDIRPSLTSASSVVVPSSSRPLLCDAQCEERSHSATWHAGCYSLVDLSGRPSEVGSGGPRPLAACCPTYGQQAASKTAGVSITQPAHTRRVPTRPITLA